jgi:hypothetical protein
MLVGNLAQHTVAARELKARPFKYLRIVRQGGTIYVVIPLNSLAAR